MIFFPLQKKLPSPKEGFAVCTESEFLAYIAVSEIHLHFFLITPLGLHAPGFDNSLKVEGPLAKMPLLQ